MGTPDITPATPNDTDWEKRYKDTQSAYTKSQQALKAEEAKNKVLEELTAIPVELEEAEKERLDNLKFENPDEWRSEINSLESEAKRAHTERITQASTEASRQAELERRAAVLEEFNANSPVGITEDVITYDIPPRITAKLEKGEVSFEDFLKEASEYLTSSKVIGTAAKGTEQPDLGSVDGGASPAEYTAEPDSIAAYRNEIY